MAMKNSHAVYRKVYKSIFQKIRFGSLTLKFGLLGFNLRSMNLAMKNLQSSQVVFEKFQVDPLTLKYDLSGFSVVRYMVMRNQHECLLGVHKSTWTFMDSLHVDLKKGSHRLEIYKMGILGVRNTNVIKKIDREFPGRFQSEFSF